MSFPSSHLLPRANHLLERVGEDMPALEGESEAAGEGLVPTESAGGPREPGPQGLGRGYNDALLKGRIF